MLPPLVPSDLDFPILDFLKGLKTGEFDALELLDPPDPGAARLLLADEAAGTMTSKESSCLDASTPMMTLVCLRRRPSISSLEIAVVMCFSKT